MAVQPFKAGPDFIDPSYHNQFCAGPSRNLDAWLMDKAGVLAEADQHTRAATGILEGVMGLFDGASPTSEEGSTMELARWLDWPVVLCMPAAKAGRSIAATLRGFLAEAHPNRLAGVVLNGVSGDSHAEYLREAIRPLGVPVLGAIPKNPMLEWPERHLGLQAAQERLLPSKADLAELARSTLDLESFAALARSHPVSSLNAQVAATRPSSTPSRRIAIAQDEAFHFYYAANLEWLAAQDAELVPFSPLHSQKLPTDIDALVIGGGFPEMVAQQLADNATLRAEIRSALNNGLPCYAECGGLMFLADQMRTADGTHFPMVGAVPGTIAMTPSLQNFGYCSAEATYHGHEFHHSLWLAENERANAWTVTRRRNNRGRREGFRSHALHASYVHLYFPNSAPLLRAQLGFSS